MVKSMAEKCEMQITRPFFSYLPFQLQPTGVFNGATCHGPTQR